MKSAYGIISGPSSNPGTQVPALLSLMVVPFTLKPFANVMWLFSAFERCAVGLFSETQDSGLWALLFLAFTDAI